MAQDESEASLGSRYVLLEEIGGGAMGTVRRARLRDTGEIVAVKLLRDGLAADQDLVLRFVQERNVMRSLRHPHIVPVRDFVVEGDRLALVMDLVEGGDLRGLLRQRDTLPPSETARLMAQVAEALAAAHALGVVHRDVKPGNVLIDTAGRARLSDFGVARIVHGPGLTGTSSIIGTPAYLAPEIAEGDAATAAVDVYALGLILYELLAGRPPFAGDHPMALLRQHATAMPRRLPGMPDALWTLIWACSAKDPAVRPTAEAVAAALHQAAPALTGLPALPPVPRTDPASSTSEPLPTPPKPTPTPPQPAPTASHASGHHAPITPEPHPQTVPSQPPSSAEPSTWPQGAGGGGAGSPARPSRKRGVLVASGALAVALAGTALVVAAPWRQEVTPVAAPTTPPSAPSTPPATPSGAAAVDIETPSPKSLAKPKERQETPKVVVTVTSTPPSPATTAPTRPVRTKSSRPKPRETERETEPESEAPPSEPPAPQWRCRSWLTTAGGVDMSPCMAVTGDVIHLKGQVRGSARSDVHVQLYDTDADTNLSQPFICADVLAPAGGVATCGPFTISVPRKGAKTDIRQRWRRTGSVSWSGGAESPYVVW
ncbi:serine/threonine-protein kinase [Nonomuraea sp. NPDC049421]|uniref:serine/threonine-protein kinase n=1 Tax=Nonomuraea sp. NPDC049421 TaxID=3155275 RepID=UPI0034187051